MGASTGRKPRVLHVIARMNVGGTAVYLANLISGLKDLGVENLLVTGSVPPGEIEDSVVETLPIRRIPELSRELSTSDRKAKLSLERIIEEFQPDLIHSHTFKAGMLVRSRKRKVPVVHTFHGHHLYDPEFGLVRKGILNLIERRLAKRCNSIVTIGEKVKQELLASGIGRESQYVSISPGIDEVKLAAASEVRQRLGFSNEKRPIVMWLGRFTRVKRPDRVVELARLNPSCVFVLAGGGELESSIRATAPENVVVAGWQKKEDMWAIADIALCTSDSEGMPLSLIEAQLCGIPVVSTNVGSVNEIVVDGVTGKLGLGNDELNAGIEWAKSQSIAELSKNISRIAHEKFGKERMASAHRDLYRKLGV